MILKAIIIDDEPLALELLESYVNKTPFIELIGQFSSALEVVTSPKLKEADILFLDIQMPILNGLEFSRMVDPKTRIIFTTAFSEYAIDSYKVNAIDYLLKPISYVDFITSANKALSWFKLSNSTDIVDVSTTPTTTNTNTTNSTSEGLERDYIYVKSEYKLIRVDLSKLLYVEGLKDYVKLYIEGDLKPVLSLMSMKSLEETLPSSMFMRVHKSYIVQKDKIKIIERSRIIFGKEYIPIGSAYKDQLKEYLTHSKF